MSLKRFSIATLRITLSIVAALLSIGMNDIFHPNVASAAPPPQILKGHVLDIVAKGHASLIAHHRSADTISLAVSLQLRNKQALNQFLNQVGNPGNRQYGLFLTQAQANQAFNPTPQQEQLVITWLKKSGLKVSGTYPNHLLVDADGTFAQIEHMLRISINDYKAPLQGKMITFYAPTNEPTIDGSVSGIVGGIVGLDNYPRIHTMAMNNASNSPPYYPQDFANAYDMNPLLDANYNGKGEHIGITLWTKPPSDKTLNDFHAKTGADVATKGNGRLQEIPTDPNKQGSTLTDEGEAGLDIEYTSGIASGAVINYYESPGSIDQNGKSHPDPQGIMNALNMAGTDASNNRQINNSWGGCESVDAFSYTIDNIIASNTATGHDYFFSSGDNGSWCAGTDPAPAYPASSAYVTSVGGTRFNTNINGGYPGEVTWAYCPSNCPNLPNNPNTPVGSGGGYSSAFERPAWQSADGLANNGKRGYPDIAAEADPDTGAFVLYGENSTSTQLGGTSLASPLWVAMIADMNQSLQAQHHSPLGFINPALYWLAMQPQPYSPFHDITYGTNGGYQTGTGWDAVTGWGSPDLYNLVRDLAASNILKVLTINTTADNAPPCSANAYSLRCAITQANSDGQGDTILFNVPSSDSHCKPTTITGTQVRVCTLTPSSSLPWLTASRTTIDGYSQPGARQNFATPGQGDNAIITVQIDGSNGVGGLVLSGNASNDTIKGLEVTNFTYGILLFPQTVTNNIIVGNFIGTDGTNALGNGAGIYIASGASYNTIGGDSITSANLISGNSGQGIVIGAGGANLIEGNYVGTDASGTGALHRNKGVPRSSPLGSKGIANGIGIVVFAGGLDNQIGGSNAHTANTIAHNIYGILTDGSSHTDITGNTISSNSIGVMAQNSEGGDRIFQNTIQNNSDAGVLVGNSSTDTTYASIRKNSIFSNGGLGIDLNPADTVNCSGPTPGTPNDYLPCPLILTATPTQVSGTACPNCLVDVYAATNETGSQGHGSGKTYEGSGLADGNGNWQANGKFSVGDWVTATATTISLNGFYEETSEFAANISVSNSSTVSLNNIQGEFFPNPNDNGVFDVTPSTPAVFTRSFPIVNFNPPPEMQSCSNSTGVDESTRPITDISPNPDGTCTLIIAQGNGQQAGATNLTSFEAAFGASFTVSSAGQLTLNILADDGWILSIGPDSHSDQPTYISGPLNNPPPSGTGPFTGYPVVGANNLPSAPVQLTLTINIPAAGTYPIELDYTECCQGDLALVVSALFTGGTSRAHLPGKPTPRTSSFLPCLTLNESKIKLPPKQAIRVLRRYTCRV